MKHLGSITDIDGAKIEPVDVIVGGSPCQDLSIAGNRAGMSGARSGLFMDQVRIIKQMREEDKRNGRTGIDVRPRFMVWENVPGAFSSSKGEDFRAVLEETARVADPDAAIPRPANGKWTTSGAIMGDGWSIAWRVLDAQFWGVPQRRRRIALVADFGGESAPEVLFERDGESRDPAEGGTQGEGTAGAVEGGTWGCLNPWDSQAHRLFEVDGILHSLNANSNGGGQRDGVVYPSIARSLTARNDGSPCVDRGPNMVAYALQGSMIGRADENGPQGDGINEDASFTLNTIDRHAVAVIKTAQTGSNGSNIADDGNAYTINGANDQVVCYPGNQITSIGNRSNPKLGDPSPTIAKSGAENMILVPVTFAMQGFGDYIESANANALRHSHDVTTSTLAVENFVVRRLTPLECTRLQGYPDDWLDIEGASDTAKYRALGNSIALPPWRYVLSRLCGQIGRKATLGSLFDGIGGFPLIWEEINGKGSAIWASEIDEFCIRVTIARFGECADQ